EERIWQQFLAKATDYPDAPIYHFGSYEPKAIRLLSKRNSTDTDWLKKRLININSYVFGKVYFPVRSNKLKTIGKFIGATWTSRDASGLQSLVWRHLWEETLNDEYRQKLLQYNQEDCNAVRLLLDELCKIQLTADSAANIDYANHPKKEATKEGKEIHDQLETILQFAQTSYDKKKISFRQKQQEEHRKRGAPKGHIGYQRVVPEAQNTINLPCREKCPRCEDQILHTSDIFTQKTVIDLFFSEGSCTKTIKKFVGCKGYCSQCRHYYDPDILDEYGEPIFGHGFQSLFGRGLQSWVVYQRLALRMPYESIIQSLEEQFSESMSKATIVRIVKLFAEYYSITGEILAQDLLASPFIHVDETKVNVEGTDHYIWVFTDGNHVVFRWTESRESAIVREFLKNYKGVLISDFYAGYDSVSCRQQKCLVHLIRDLNDDLWKSPFDGEFEGFVLKVKNLLVPILEVASEYGLREEYLSGFRPDVSDFYERNIDNNHYCSELTLKYQKRFKRYRQSLFTFLETDSIPWNNNQAERALRHIVIQASISQTFYKSVVQHYLLLLGLMQSCRCQEKSFLKFLLSGEREIDAFKGTSQLVTSRIVSSQ
ncbi:MAG: TM0106 family RecB-like putative nuclease, partial [Bacteroidota bacterium]